MNEKLENLIKKHKVMVATYDCYSEDDWHYEDFQESMKDYLKSMGNEWHIDAKNINWQGRTGSLETDDIDDVISATLFHDGQCRTEVWEEGNALEGVCYHHDCPTGSWFTITGIKE
jgi:hypothetical protein|tara:strand:+ start:2554 stop:2901 length:348 start_codon:yes stop_codon:yes gene_type:complete